MQSERKTQLVDKQQSWLLHIPNPATTKHQSTTENTTAVNTKITQPKEFKHNTNRQIFLDSGVKLASTKTTTLLCPNQQEQTFQNQHLWTKKGWMLFLKIVSSQKA